MNFLELLDKNDSYIISIAIKKGMIIADQKVLDEEFKKLEENLLKTLSGADSNYVIDLSKAVKPEEELIFEKEGTIFDKFYKLMAYYQKGEHDKARQEYDELHRLAQTDYDAKVAMSMCKYYGVFEKKNEGVAWEEINSYACFKHIPIACSLLAQHYYSTYEKNNNSKARELAIEFLKKGIKGGSKTAIAFNNKKHLI